MYKYLYVVGFLALNQMLISQSSTKSISSEILSATESKKVKFSDEGQDHFMFNFTLDNVLNGSPDSFYRSNVFNPNLGFYFLYDMPFGKSGISVAPGVGFTFSKVNLDGTILTQNAQGTTFMNATKDPQFAAGGNFNYDGSSFYSSWVEAPFELRYKSEPMNGRSRIKVAVGVRAGINLATNSKMSYYDKTIQREVTSKLSPFSELNSFRYGVTFRVGYGAINLFGYYGLNQLIKENRNINNLDLRQYSIGIAITGM